MIESQHRILCGRDAGFPQKSGDGFTQIRLAGRPRPRFTRHFPDNDLFGRRWVLVQQIGRPYAEGIGGLPERCQRDVLLAPLHAGDMGTINAHLCRQGFLAGSGRHPVAAHIESEQPANVHPQDGCGWRILLLRIIIRD